MIKKQTHYLTIKEFSEFTHTSIDTLKHYDRIGLLKPAYIGENNYRYYLPEQSLLLTRILFDTRADIPLKAIRDSVQNEMPDAVMAHYEKISKDIQLRIAELEAIQGTIRNMKYYYSLAKTHQPGTLFSIYLPEWFIIRSAPLPMHSRSGASDADIANQIFRKGFYNGQWPHYLLGALCDLHDIQENQFPHISYYLKIDHPEQFPQEEIQFIRSGIWHCLIMKVHGKGLATAAHEFVQQLETQRIAVEKDIFVMDVVNNLLTADPKEYCTMVYALEKEIHYDPI